MAAPSEPTGFRALVVDDEAIVRGMVVLALLNEGFTCDVATDGEKAKTLMEEGQYDLLVTDLKMPYLDGYSLALDALQGNTAPSVMVHTAYEDPRSVKELLARGVDDIVSKPTDYAVFAAKARGIVARRRAMAQAAAPAAAAAVTAADAADAATDSPAALTDESSQPAAPETEALASSTDHSKSNSSAVRSAGAKPSAAPAGRAARANPTKVLRVTERSAPTAEPIAKQDATFRPAGPPALAAFRRKYVRGAACLLTIAGGASLAVPLRGVLQHVQEQNLPTSSLLLEVDTTLQQLPESGLMVGRNVPDVTATESNIERVVADQAEALYKLGQRAAELLREKLFYELGKAEPQAMLATATGQHGSPTDAASDASQLLTQTAQAFQGSSRPGAQSWSEWFQLLQVAYEPSTVAEKKPDPNRAQLEAEFAQDLAEIQQRLAPLLAAGYAQPGRGGTVLTAIKGPISLSALERCGALDNSADGLARLAEVMTSANDRPVAEIPTAAGDAFQEEQRQQVVAASRLLRKYQRLLVEQGMLAE